MTIIQIRRGTAAQWTAANPVLAAGEPGYESDTGKEKRGNGSSAWTALPYFAGGSGLAPLNSPTFTGTVGGITKSMVGLPNADNVSDANKPISIATQDALDDKRDSAALITLADLPPETLIRVRRSGVNWTYNGVVITARPTSRTDIGVFFIGGVEADQPAWALDDDIQLEVAP